MILRFILCLWLTVWLMIFWVLCVCVCVSEHDIVFLAWYFWTLCVDVYALPCHLVVLFFITFSEHPHPRMHTCTNVNTHTHTQAHANTKFYITLKQFCLILASDWLIIISSNRWWLWLWKSKGSVVRADPQTHESKRWLEDNVCCDPTYLFWPSFATVSVLFLIDGAFCLLMGAVFFLFFFFLGLCCLEIWYAVIQITLEGICV